MQGTNTIKAITTGNNIVQEKDINWSKRILGKEALTHINMNTIMDDLIPMVRPYIIPSNTGEEKKLKAQLPIVESMVSGFDIKM